MGPFPCLEPFQNLAVGRGQKAFQGKVLMGGGGGINAIALDMPTYQI